jgi:uncharacterized protein
MRVAEADLLFLPGLSDSERDHWQGRWLHKLSTARKVEQEDWNAPRCAIWRAAIEQAIESSRRPVVVVAHSLGVIALLHAAEAAGSRIAGAFLVAPPSESALLEIPAVDRAFLPIPRRRLVFPALVVAGSDDPYAPPPFARELAQDIGATFLDAGASGHINVASGHGPWPEGLLAFAHFVAKL